MADAYLGEIRAFPFNFAPRGWALCAGQLMPISQNTALFSLLGTIYGGDGRSTFALPNLQGAVPLGQGQSPGLSAYSVGQTDGAATVTLLPTENGNHNHAMNADGDRATSTSPAGAVYMAGHYAGPPAGQVLAYSASAPDTVLDPRALQSIGGGQPHNNMMPYLALTFCICVNGIFPPRS